MSVGNRQVTERKADNERGDHTSLGVEWSQERDKHKKKGSK